MVTRCRFTCPLTRESRTSRGSLRVWNSYSPAFISFLFPRRVTIPIKKYLFRMIPSCSSKAEIFLRGIPFLITMILFKEAWEGGIRRNQKRRDAKQRTEKRQTRRILCRGKRLIFSAPDLLEIPL